MTEQEFLQKFEELQKELHQYKELEQMLEKICRKGKIFRQTLKQEASFHVLKQYDALLKPMYEYQKQFQNCRGEMQKVHTELRKNDPKELQKRNMRKEALKKLQNMQEQMQSLVEEERKKEETHLTTCKNYSTENGAPFCEVQMDITFCGTKCPYATIYQHNLKVDSKGNTIRKKK